MSPYSSPSPITLDVRDQFTTTTLFADPTFLGSQSSAGASTVPVAAIAGGAAGGVILAVFAVCGWKWWGRKIKEREKRELERRVRTIFFLTDHIYQELSGSGDDLRNLQKAIQAASAYRRSVLSGKIFQSRSEPRRSRPPSTNRKVQFTGIPAPASPHIIAANASAAISTPRPLRAVTYAADAPISTSRPSGTLKKSRGNLRAGKSYRPMRPSPLSQASTVKSNPPHESGEQATSDAPITASERVMPHSISIRERLLPLDEKWDDRSPPVGRIPRIKASLSSLRGEARRQSKASQNSASDQSRHSSAGGSARRWSWWSLINGPGFSFRQVGIGTGKNRLSADTSVLDDWQEEDPSLPIGYAYSGVDDGSGDINSDNKSPVIHNVPHAGRYS